MERVRRGSDRSDILRYWWMLELFSPQKLPAETSPATQTKDHQVIAWEKKVTLPWHSLRTPRSEHKTPWVWRHTVYLGVYHLKDTFDILGRIFGEDHDAYERAPRDKSACAGLLIDDDGRLITGSAMLSSALWATGRAHRRGASDPLWMEGFELAQEQFTNAVDAYEVGRRNACSATEPLPQTPESLLELLTIAQDCADISDLAPLAQSHIIIDSQAVPRPKDGAPPPEIEFLNSFFLEDLAAVRHEVARGNLGTGLAAYLSDDSEVTVSERIDVVARPEVVDAGTRVARIPKGRWPTNPEHSLALSQQFAVNQALHELTPSAGIMGVNGPPGTGKTTMLRDILAGNVVDRARQLAALTRPSDAFRGEARWISRNYPRRVPRLIPELTGFEMVVASANNAAVENVTAEIPAESAIADQWRGRVSYFKEIASEILFNKPTGSWGLIAAKLGNKNNRSKFHSEFWFGPQAKEHSHADDVPRMMERLTRWKEGKDPVTPWPEARKAFRRAESRVDALLNQRKQAEERIVALKELLRRRHGFETQLHHQRHIVDQTRQAAQRHGAVEQGAKSVATTIFNRRDRHVSTKPGLLEIIFTFGKAVRRWRSQLEDLDAELSRAEEHHQQLLAEGEELRNAAVTAQRGLAAIESELAVIATSHGRLLEQCSHDATTIGKGYPGPTWQGDQRELHAPWLDAELDRARSDLFIAALKLHEDFFANTAAIMERGLRGACEVVAGSAPRDLTSEKVLAAWQLFFLVVPMVSTTFASASRMFKGLGQESIGWLLIDQAGQAAPQLAVGAIWRARRIIAVGDPMQLEPVVTIPEKARRNIAVKYNVGDTWIPPKASVQTLADRVTRYGTTLDQGEERVWVSAPLRVHRRCDDPMFSFCNAVAYNDLMVNGVHRVLDDPMRPDQFDSPVGPRITPSQWIHIPSETRGSYLQNNQVAELRRALDHLTGQGVDPKDVFAISPFRDVAVALKSVRSQYQGLKTGTIHTAQGQEASVVFLVLGGDPAKPGGPAMWAETPNLINVAVSRAKRRIYVIGDLGMWGRQNYFRDLKALLRPSS